MSGAVRIGPLTLRCPDGYELLHSHGADASQLERFVLASPDHTLYHTAPYRELAGRLRFAPETLVGVARGGELLLVLPIMAESAFSFTTSYSGVVFPPGEGALKRTATALERLIETNRHLRRMHSIQSVQGRGARDAERRRQIDYLISRATPSGAVEHLFTRILQLAPARVPLERRAASGVLQAEELDAEIAKGYDADLRNQIRQAGKHGLRVRWYLFDGAANDATIEEAYRGFLSVHEVSWRRTGLTPHSADYWHGLARAIGAAGGFDLVVLVDGERGPIAAVTCHLYQQQALYASGCSIEEGLRKRANPLALHAAVTICRRLGFDWFEIGRFSAQEAEKVRRITHYKSQFGGRVVRMANFRVDRSELRPVVEDEVWRVLHRFPSVWRALGVSAFEL